MPVAPALTSSPPHDHDSVPGRSSVATLVRALDDLARVQRESAARIARDLDLARASLGLLRMLDHCGTVQVGDIAAKLRVDVSVASRQVSHLVDDGLARRKVDDDDRRARTIELTESGRDLLRRTEVVVERISAETFSAWTDDEIAAATRQLARITDAVTGALTPANPASHEEHHTV